MGTINKDPQVIACERAKRRNNFRERIAAIGSIGHVDHGRSASVLFSRAADSPLSPTLSHETSNVYFGEMTLSVNKIRMCLNLPLSSLPYN